MSRVSIFACDFSATATTTHFNPGNLDLTDASNNELDDWLLWTFPPAPSDPAVSLVRNPSLIDLVIVADPLPTNRSISSVVCHLTVGEY